VGAAGACWRLVRAAMAEARRSNAARLEIRAREPVACGLSAGRNKVTVLLELPPDPHTLWLEFRSKLRNKIRRAQREGLEVRVGADQLEPFYDVFARNMRDLGTPVLPRLFFERVASRFTGRVEFTAIWWRDQPVAGGCGFVWRDEFEITWASSLRQHNARAPNMLLYWSLMERMSRRGVRVFNFGRCTPGGGTHVFKRQWGGADVPLHWKQWAGRAGAGSASYDAAVYRAAAAVWRRLPVPVTRRLGPLLARQLP
jgi:FemAB-related protein (PEP-CTERM system-associated)